MIGQISTFLGTKRAPVSQIPQSQSQQPLQNAYDLTQEPQNPQLQQQQQQQVYGVIGPATVQAPTVSVNSEHVGGPVDTLVSELINENSRLSEEVKQLRMALQVRN